jgi:hypothetical protein
MISIRQRSVIAGLLYFSTHVTSVAALIAFGTESPDIVGFDQTPYLIGVLLEFLLAVGVVGTGVALLPVLRPHGESLAHTFSSLRNVEAAVIIGGAMAMLAATWTITSGAADTRITEALFELHRASFLIGQGLVISVNSIVIGHLLRRSRLVAPWIGALGMLGGTIVFFSNLAQLSDVIAFGGIIAGAAAIPLFAFEICFAGYMVTRGLRLVDTTPVLGVAGTDSSVPIP